MKTVLIYFLFAISSFAAQFTIGAGNGHFGAGSGSLNSTVTVNVSGSGSGSAFVYFTMAGRLAISLPPQVSGTCSGTSCDVFTTIGGSGGSLYHYGSSAYPTDRAGLNSFAVDPVFSQSGTIADAVSPLDDASLFQYGGPGPFELGTTIYSDVNGYVLGIRFNKPPTDTSSSHSVSLWDANGQSLASATSTNESPNGWQTVLFTSPVSIQAKTLYTVSYYTTQPFWFNDRLLQNRIYGPTLIHAAANYAQSNGSCNVNDSWPLDKAGRPAAGLIGCIEISNGAITSIKNADAVTSSFASEGCQCMIGGIGPGPYKFQNNFVSAVGLGWHHDDSGGNWAQRGDYTYERNTFFTPFSRMYGHPSSDGMRYMHRQPLEWKSGQRISLVGNLFDQSWVEGNPTGATVTLTSVAGQGITDVNAESNTFRHVPALMSATQIVEGGAPVTRPTSRFRFQNNLAYDVNQKMTYWVNGGFAQPTGWVFTGPNGSEDITVDHNTIAGNLGRVPSVMHLYSTKTDGVKVTNNIFYLSSSNPGLTIDGGLVGPPCGGGGKTLADCMFTGGYRWDHNLLLGDSSQGTIQSYWSTLNNYIPSNPSDLSGVGWFSRNNNDYRIRSTFCSGCGSAASDLKDLGADIDQLESAQGSVKLIGVPTSGLSTTSAMVAFVAPDAQACPVDYSSTDPTLIQSFLRAADTGSGRTRNVILTGLTAKTLYRYRINCAVEQPTGRFRTK